MTFCDLIEEGEIYAYVQVSIASRVGAQAMGQVQEVQKVVPLEACFATQNLVPIGKDYSGIYVQQGNVLLRCGH